MFENQDLQQFIDKNDIIVLPVSRDYDEILKLCRGKTVMGGFIGNVNEIDGVKIINYAVSDYFRIRNALPLSLIHIFPMDDITGFLYFIGSVFAPMIAVLIADFFILKRNSFNSGIDIANLIVWFAGFVCYRLFMRIDLITGSTTPAMAITFVLCLIAVSYTHLKRHHLAGGFGLQPRDNVALQQSRFCRHESQGSCQTVRIHGVFP